MLVFVKIGVAASHTKDVGNGLVVGWVDGDVFWLFQGFHTLLQSVIFSRCSHGRYTIHLFLSVFLLQLF